MKKITIILLLITSLVNAQEFNCENEDFNKLIDFAKKDQLAPDALIEKFTGFKHNYVENIYDESVTDLLIFNDSILGVIVSFSTGVSLDETLFTFSCENKRIDSMQLLHSTDMDLSITRHVSQDYQIFEDGLIEIYEIIIVANDSCLDEAGNFINDYDAINCGRETNYYSYFIINELGKYKGLSLDNNNIDQRKYGFASTKLLTIDDLKHFNKTELRLIRNEIFANKGYDFKSEDLKTYFSQFPWYNPYTSDVNDKLTLIEIKNIKLIKKMESE